MDSNEIFGQSANTGTVSFEELENAFKTPTQRQEYYEPSPSSADQSDNLGQLADPDGTAKNDWEGEKETEPIDPEKAKRTGERIARIIDTGIDFTLSNFVAQNDQSYKADEKDLDDIAQCWGEISEERNWNIGPEWTLVILYLMVYGPLVRQAFTDRKTALLEERQAVLEKRVSQIEQQQPSSVQMPTNNGSENPNPSAFDYQPAR